MQTTLTLTPDPNTRSKSHLEGYSVFCMEELHLTPLLGPREATVTACMTSKVHRSATLYMPS